MSNAELLLSPQSITLYGKPVEGVTLDSDKFGHPIKYLLERSGETALKLANIYGYQHDGQFYQLPSATAFLVTGDGEVCEGDEFPEDYKHWKKHNKWVADPADPSIRFEVESGTLQQLLIEPTDTEDALAGEGTLIRGADGRMYYIPESLDDLEVRSEDEKSALSLADSTELPDLRVSSTTFRGRLTFRGRMVLRGRMTFRGRMAFRGRMTAPNRCR